MYLCRIKSFLSLKEEIQIRPLDTKNNTPSMPLYDAHLGGLLFLQPMTKKSYNKPPLAFVDQLQKLKNRGLEILDDQRSISYLQQKSYYRLVDFPVLIFI